MDVSVVICCYNSEPRIEEVLLHLKHQVASGMNWEVILVDNASTDNTAEAAQNFWNKSKKVPVDFRIVKEPKPGLMHARWAGIDNALGEVIVFCDDDNLLFQDYVNKCYQLMTNESTVGIAGGQNLIKSDGEIPDWWEDYSEQFAVGRQGEQTGDITDRLYVWGAGMVVRKDFLEDLKRSGFKSLLLGRTGKDLSSGEDAEMCAMAILWGYRLYYHEELKLFHKLPDSRLTYDYLKRMQKGHDESYHKVIKWYHFYIRNTAVTWKKFLKSAYGKIIHTKAINILKDEEIRAKLQMLLGRSFRIHATIQAIQNNCKNIVTR